MLKCQSSFFFSNINKVSNQNVRVKYDETKVLDHHENISVVMQGYTSHIFLIFALKHRLWVLVRTALLRMFS